MGNLAQAFLLVALLMNMTMLFAYEYSYVQEDPYAESYSEYLNQRGIPKVSLISKCNKDKSSCWEVVMNQKGQQLKYFGQSDSVSELGSGRYKGTAYLLLKHAYDCGDSTCSRNILINSQGVVKVVGKLPWYSWWAGEPLALTIGKDGIIHAVTEESYIQFTPGKEEKVLVAPEPLLSAEFGSNVDGRVTLVAVADSGKVLWSDGSKWQDLNIPLALNGDRVGVASVFPWDSTTQYIALYRYINAYNKGLYVLKFNPETSETFGGWLFNSEVRNVGFDPTIYRKRNGAIVVAGENSSQGYTSSFGLKINDFKKMNTSYPKHVIEGGFAAENLLSFQLGVSVSKISWQATSKIEKSRVKYIDVDYFIADSLFTSANFEGRIGTTSLSLQYLQNEAEDLVADSISPDGGTSRQYLSKLASNYLLSTIDFYALLTPSSTLRIQAEIGSTSGVANAKFKNGSVTYQEFNAKSKRISVVQVMERGYFMGVDYMTYTMPSAVGFSDSNNAIVYANLDPELRFKSLSFVGGYDSFAYAKRYETNYHHFYWSGSGNIGLGVADISTPIQIEAKAMTGRSNIEAPTYFSLGANVELGYIWQERFRHWKGLGYSLGLGYRGGFSSLSAGQSESANVGSNDLSLEFSRQDITHGPFFKMNIIF